MPTSQGVPSPSRPNQRPHQIQLAQKTHPRVQSPVQQPLPPLLAQTPPITALPTSGACWRLNFSNETLPRVAQAEHVLPQIATDNNSHPRVEVSPIAHQTRSRTVPLALFTEGNQYHNQVTYHIPTAKCSKPTHIIEYGFAGLVEHMGMAQQSSVHFAHLCEALALLDPNTGNLLEQGQLRKHPKLKPTWDTSFSNELGRLCQGIGTGTTPSKQQIAGTNTFRIIDYKDIPQHKRNQICHTKVVCDVRPDKDDPNCTQITIGGNRIRDPGDDAPTRPC